MNFKSFVVCVFFWGVFWVVVVIVLFYVFFFFYWVIKISLMGLGELLCEVLFWWFIYFSLKNFIEVLINGGFLCNLFNLVVVVIGMVLLSLLLLVFVVYVFGKFCFKGKLVLMYIILVVSVFLQIVVFLGFYIMVKGFGFYNIWWGLILSYMIFMLFFIVWMLISFVCEIFIELEEVVYVDGVMLMQMFFQVLFLVMILVLVMIGLFVFINVWNEYLFVLMFIFDNVVSMVFVVIVNFLGVMQYEIFFGLMMVVSVIVMVLLLLLVLVFQCNIVSGLMVGVVKG